MLTIQNTCVYNLAAILNEFHANEQPNGCEMYAKMKNKEKAKQAISRGFRALCFVVLSFDAHLNFPPYFEFTCINDKQNYAKRPYVSDYKLFHSKNRERKKKMTTKKPKQKAKNFLANCRQ